MRFTNRVINVNMRMPFRACSLLLLLVALAAGCSDRANDTTPAAPAPAPKPAAPSGDARGPNVVWILLDALRPDHLSAYGYERETSPFIDTIAQRGTLFERHYSQGPNTLISVGTYMTGRYFPVEYQDARHMGVWFLKEPLPGEELVSTIFGRQGYATAMFSASPWYSAESRLATSFETFGELMRVASMDLDRADFVKDNAELFSWISDHAAEPFFLYVHSLDTHEPRYRYNTVSTWLDPAFPRERGDRLRWWKDGPFSAEDQRYITGLYDGGIAYADFTVSQIVAALEREGVLDNTILVISSDHGEVLAQDGETLGHPPHGATDDQLRTPLILAGPGIPSGKRIGVKTQNVDIVPTIIDLAGLSTESKFDGVSLRDTILADAPAEIHRYAFSKTSSISLTSRLNSIFIFDDAKVDICAYDEAQLAKSNRPIRPRELVWKMPDFAGARTPATLEADRESYVQAELSDRIQPMRAARDAQPDAMPPYYDAVPGVAFTEQGQTYPIVNDLNPSDNLWSSVHFGAIFEGIGDSMLVSFPWLEDSPGLVMIASARDGTYRVSALLKTFPSPDGTARGASFRWLEPVAERDFRLFRVPPAEPGQENRAWVELGTYTVTGGKFVYWLDEGLPEDVTVFGTLRFVREGAEGAVLTDEELAAEHERLKALGYGDN